MWVTDCLVNPIIVLFDPSLQIDPVRGTFVTCIKKKEKKESDETYS